MPPRRLLPILCLAGAAVVVAWFLLSHSREDERPAPTSRVLAEPDAAPTFAAAAPSEPSQEIAVRAEPAAEPAAVESSAKAEPKFLWPRQDPDGKPYRITGRVLMPDGVTPAAGARVNLDDAGYDDNRTLTDEAGRFVISPTPGVAFEGAQLFAVSADERAWGERLGIGSDAKGDMDLGDFVLEVLRRVELLLVDSQGRPVPDAMALLEVDDRGRGRASDADGLLVVEPLPAPCRSVEIWARGFARKTVSVEPLPLAPVKVTLSRCPILALHVRGADGGSPEGFMVEVKAAEEIVYTPRPVDLSFSVHRSIAERVGLTEPIWVQRLPGPDGAPGTAVRYVFQPFADEPIVIGDLRSGVELEISLVAAGGGLAWGPERLTLAPEEIRELQLAPVVRSKRIEVRVRGPDGQPVDGGWVTLGAPGAMIGATDWCDAGVAEFDNVLLDRALITLNCPPAARTVLRDVSLVAGVPVEITLAPGLSVEVSLVDAGGQPARADDVFVSIGGVGFPNISHSPSDPERDAKSTFVIDALPPGPVRLLFTHGGERAILEGDTSQPKWTLTVPWSDAPR